MQVVRRGAKRAEGADHAGDEKERGDGTEAAKFGGHSERTHTGEAGDNQRAEQPEAEVAVGQGVLPLERGGLGSREAGGVGVDVKKIVEKERRDEVLDLPRGGGGGEAGQSGQERPGDERNEAWSRSDEKRACGHDEPDECGERHNLGFGPRRGSEENSGQPEPGGAVRGGWADREPAGGGDEERRHELRRVVGEIGESREGVKREGRENRGARGGEADEQDQGFASKPERAENGREADEAGDGVARGTVTPGGGEKRVIVQRSGRAAVDGAPENGIVPEGNGSGDELTLVGVSLMGDPEERPAEGEERAADQEPPEPARWSAETTGPGRAETRDGGQEKHRPAEGRRSQRNE